jgi:hypothetical protein
VLIAFLPITPGWGLPSGSRQRRSETKRHFHRLLKSTPPKRAFFFQRASARVWARIHFWALQGRWFGWKTWHNRLGRPEEPRHDRPKTDFRPQM